MIVSEDGNRPLFYTFLEKKLPVDRATFRLIATGIMTVVAVAVMVAPTGVQVETLRATASRMTVSTVSIISKEAVKEDLSVCQGRLKDPLVRGLALNLSRRGPHGPLTVV